MRNALLLAVALCASTWASGQTLDEHLQQAVALNPGLQARYAEFEAALTRSAQVRDLPDPVLGIGFFITPRGPRNGPQAIRFTLSQMFPWFGTLGAQARAADLQAEASYQAFLEARNELFFMVRAAYYPLHELERTITLKRSELGILQSHRELALARFEGGQGRMVDVLRADLLINEERTDIEVLQERRKPLMVAFYRTVGYADLAQVDISDTLTLVDLVASYSVDSLLVNPRMTELERNVAAAQADAEAARKQGFPQFGLSLDYGVEQHGADMAPLDRGRNMIMPMLSVSLPIYRNKYRGAVEEAQAMERVYQDMRTQVENDLNSAYEIAWFDAYKAARTVQLLDRQIQVAEQVLSLLLSAYANTGVEFEEVLRMQQQVLLYKLMRLAAMREHHTAVARLDHITAKQLNN